MMCLGSDKDDHRVLSQSTPPCRPVLGGNSPYAKEVWAVPLQSRNSYHVDFSKGMHHIAVSSAAATTKWWIEWLVRKGYAHKLTSSLSLFPFTPTINPRAHTHTYIYTPVLKPGEKGEICELWGSAQPLLQCCGHKTKALVTWKNSWNLQEEVEHLRDYVWILSALFWAKCQSWGGCCW